MRQADVAQRFFDFSFQNAPHFIGLAVGDMGAGESAVFFCGRFEGMHRAIERADDLPNRNFARSLGETIATLHAFAGFNDSGAA